MTFTQGLLLFFAAVLGGTLNAVAGGGSFFTFPALIFTNIGPIVANATSTVALWPGSIASVGAYRRELVEQQRGFLFLLIGTSLIGGVLGAVLLLRTPQSTFVSLIPYLLLGATLLFAVSPYLTTRLRLSSIDKDTRISTTTLVVIAIAQFIIAIYGGYFGGGIGFLILALLTGTGVSLRAAGATKNVLAALINLGAVLVFVLSPAVQWRAAALVCGGSIVGGLAGSWALQRIPERLLRGLVVAIGVLLAAGLFAR